GLERRSETGARVRRKLGSGGGARLLFFAQQSPNSLGRLGSDAEPILDAILLELEGAGFGQRVVGAELLQKAPITGSTGVSSDDSVKWTFFGAAAGEPDLDGHSFSVKTPANSEVGEATGMK